MLVTTRYYNSENKCYTEHRGLPRKKSSFESRSANAVRIEIWYTGVYDMSQKNFTKSEDGRWFGNIRNAGNGKYYREELAPKQTLMHIQDRVISEQEYNTIMEQEIARAMDAARKTLRWCKPEDENDEDGRYWLSAYAGAEVYRIIVQNGKIIGSLPGGYHRSCPFSFNQEAWRRAVIAAIDEKVEGDYKLLKADGSGCYFYLRNQEDAQYLTVKEYDVPSARGGLHHNIEVR